MDDHGRYRRTLRDPNQSGPSTPDSVGLALAAFNSTKMTWVGMAPMFSPWCCCAGNQLVTPADMSTSRFPLSELSLRRKELRVYMTLSGCWCGVVLSPGRSVYSSTRTT